MNPRKMTTEQIVEAVWNGNSNPTWSGPKPPPRPPKSDEEIALIKRQIETMLDEYEQDLLAFDKWLRDWRARQPRGFRRAHKSRQAQGRT
jgi:hypothetical protein